MNTIRLSLLGAALALAGCGGGGSTSSSGSLTLGITDAPVDDAADVVIEISGVEIHGNGGSIDINYDEPRSVHLLELADGASDALLANYSLPAGHYQWIRLKVNTGETGDSYVVTSTGATYEIYIPNGAENGLKLVRGFDVPAGGTADFTIDFDLRKSLVDRNTEVYTLKPVLRIVDNTEVGSIAGTVDISGYVCDAAQSAVYVYAGHGVTLADINTLTGTGPLVVAPVRDPDANNSEYHYRAAFLPTGNYMVALTCQAGSDNPETTEILEFKAQYDVSVTAGQATGQPFDAP